MRDSKLVEKVVTYFNTHQSTVRDIRGGQATKNKYSEERPK